MPSIVVAVPAAGFLAPLCLLLLILAKSVSAAERSCEGKVGGPAGVTLPLGTAAPSFTAWALPAWLPSRMPR